MGSNGGAAPKDKGHQAGRAWQKIPSIRARVSGAVFDRVWVACRPGGPEAAAYGAGRRQLPICSPCPIVVSKEQIDGRAWQKIPSIRARVSGAVFDRVWVACRPGGPEAAAYGD